MFFLIPWAKRYPTDKMRPYPGLNKAITDQPEPVMLQAHTAAAQLYSKPGALPPTDELSRKLVRDERDSALRV